MMVINDLEESGSGLDVPCGVIGLAYFTYQNCIFGVLQLTYAINQ